MCTGGGSTHARRVHNTAEPGAGKGRAVTVDDSRPPADGRSRPDSGGVPPDTKENHAHGTN